MRIDGKKVITNDHVIALDELPRSLVAVGAGVIGLEYASMFAALGVEVTVVDARERPLAFLDGEIFDEIVHQLRNRDVTFRLGEKVAGVEFQRQNKPVVYLESGKRLASDLVLVSAGREANTQYLNLRAIGLKTDDRKRLKVDENYRTAVPHIFAAGDVIGFPSLVD